MDEVQLDGLRDVNGFAPIGDYGVLGDGRGTALVAGDGSVDWWAVPRLDSEPAFAALLDPERGGCVQLRPVATNATSTRRYVPDTNLLETTFTTATGQVRITDSLKVGSPSRCRTVRVWSARWPGLSEVLRRVACVVRRGLEVPGLPRLVALA